MIKMKAPHVIRQRNFSFSHKIKIYLFLKSPKKRMVEKNVDCVVYLNHVNRLTNYSPINNIGFTLIVVNKSDSLTSISWHAVSNDAQSDFLMNLLFLSFLLVVLSVQNYTLDISVRSPSKLSRTKSK